MNHKPQTQLFAKHGQRANRYKPYMFTNAQLRKAKLEQLASDYARKGGIVHIAVLAECNPGTLDQILKGVKLKPKADGTQTPRSLGDALARKIERAFSLPEGWFDAPDAPEGLGVDAQALAASFHSLPMKTPEQREKRQKLYWQIDALIRLELRTLPNRPALAPGGTPTAQPQRAL